MTGPRCILQQALNKASFPVIGSEWEQWESTLIGQIAQQPVAETIAHGNGGLDLVALDDDALIPIGTAGPPEVLGGGWMEHAVGTSDLKSSTFLFIVFCG